MQAIPPEWHISKINWNMHVEDRHWWARTRRQPCLTWYSGTERGFRHLDQQFCKEELVSFILHLRHRLREDNQLAQGHTSSEPQSWGLSRWWLGYKAASGLWVTCPLLDPSPQSPWQQPGRTLVLTFLQGQEVSPWACHGPCVSDS